MEIETLETVADIEAKMKEMLGDRYEQYRASMSVKVSKEPTEYANIVEVKDKYGYLSGYRINIKSIRKKKFTQIVKIAGRIDKDRAYKMATEEMNRLCRKFRVSI